MAAMFKLIHTHTNKPMPSIHHNVFIALLHIMAMDGPKGTCPKWAEGLLCAHNQRCLDGECDNLHLAEEQLKRVVRDPTDGGKLIICAGPERSGIW